jgi:hypothetical protein
MFRISIRDLLWLTVVVAMGVAWWIDRGRLAERMRRQDEAYRSLVNWIDDGTVIKLGGSGEPSPLTPANSQARQSSFPGGFSPPFSQPPSAPPSATGAFGQKPFGQKRE